MKTQKLNQLLATLWCSFFNLRNAHWNVEAINFMELHKLFQSFYEEIEDFADDVAERLRQLGEKSAANLKFYVENTLFSTTPDALTNPKEAIVYNMNGLINIKVLILDIMQDLSEDEATRNLLANMVQEIEKKIWILKSYNV